MPPTSSRPRKMPFGKFKGIYLHDLPDDYLEWLSGLDNLREPLLTWVQEEFDAREAQSKMPAGDAKPMDRAVVAMAQEVIASGYHSSPRCTTRTRRAGTERTCAW